MYLSEGANEVLCGIYLKKSIYLKIFLTASRHKIN